MRIDVVTKFHLILYAINQPLRACDIELGGISTYRLHASHVRGGFKWILCPTTWDPAHDVFIDVISQSIQYNSDIKIHHLVREKWRHHENSQA